MIAYQSYIFFILVGAAGLGLYILVKAMLLTQKSATGVSTAGSEPPAEFDPALLLSKSGKPLAGTALQNRLEALARRQRQGKPLESK